MAHLAYGIAIESDLPLAVPDAGDRPADVTIAELARVPDARRVVWDLDDERTGWSGGALGGGYYLAFADEAAFTISGDGRRIGWTGSAPPETTLVHLLLDHVVPLALARAGRFVLHAACLAFPAGTGCGALAIAGPSGRGKSTLAAALAAAGARILADDCTAIELAADQPRVAPAYPGLRLGGDSLAEAEEAGATVTGPVTASGAKQRILPAGHDLDRWDGDERVPLRTLFVLDEPGSAAMDLLGPAEATFALLEHAFHLGSPAERTDLLERATTVAAAVPVHRLRYRRTAAGLRRAVAAIAETLPSAG